MSGDRELLEYEDGTAPDASRTFSPVRRPDPVCSATWIVVLVIAIAVLCTLVHVVAGVL